MYGGNVAAAYLVSLYAMPMWRNGNVAAMAAWRQNNDKYVAWRMARGVISRGVCVMT